MKVVKNSGHIVDFDRNKLKRSLEKSGADTATVKSVLNKIEKSLYHGISTRQIYKQAFSLLKKEANAHAARYNLRTALRQLGPAGFFFEKFISRLYTFEGFETKTNLTLKGKCVSHEIDVCIKKDSTIAIVECKFHSNQNTHSDVKVPMYILSRFNDVKAVTQPVFSDADTINKCIIVTNNRFTSDAITFANCSGLELLSWNYPPEDNIKTKIDNNFLFPVTCLTTLSMAEKEKLLILDIILVNELINNSDSLEKLGISSNRVKNILKEASELCNYL